MVNDRKITFVNNRNLLDVIEVNLLCAFEFENTKYIVYDKNEKDYADNIIIYFGKIENIDDRQYIRNVNEQESLKIKDIIKKMINYNGDEYDG